MVSPIVYWVGFSLPTYVVYYLFTKGRLPKSYAWVIGRIVHFITLPFIVVFQELGLRGNFYDKIDDHVYLGAMVMGYQIPLLKSKSITAVVNMCDEFSGPVVKYQQSGIEQLHLPTIDHLEPTIEDIKTAISFIDSKVKQGHNVLIHCRAGRGRSGAIAFCWLLYRHGYDLSVAQQKLRSFRKKVRQRLYMQPTIKKYYEYLQSLPASTTSSSR
eukprot:TRINITY_DN4210_c0_g1_i1.p1 TRINITY_DN4210_c0_g1~~TRINITY_DN4210_c0_g1_i1.p1  ORF type:complete len:240 (+),score=28.38 TRINITY_DN4210_c0_g1_i1:79-720(+)